MCPERGSYNKGTGLSVSLKRQERQKVQYSSYVQKVRLREDLHVIVARCDETETEMY